MVAAGLFDVLLGIVQLRPNLSIPWWFYVFVMLVGLSVSQFLVFHDTRIKRQGIQRRLDALLISARNALAIEGLKVNMGKEETTGMTEVTVGIVFHNLADVLLKYHMVSMHVIIGGRTLANPSYKSTDVYIHPTTTSEFYYPSIPDVDLSKGRVEGKIEYLFTYRAVPATGRAECTGLAERWISPYSRAPVPRKPNIGS